MKEKLNFTPTFGVKYISVMLWPMDACVHLTKSRNGFYL